MQCRGQSGHLLVANSARPLQIGSVIGTNKGGPGLEKDYKLLVGWPTRMELGTKLANFCTSLVHLCTKRISNEPDLKCEKLNISESVRNGMLATGG